MGWEGLPLWPGMGSAETQAESLMPIKVKFICISWHWLGQPWGGLQAYERLRTLRNGSWRMRPEPWQGQWGGRRCGRRGCRKDAG